MEKTIRLIIWFLVILCGIFVNQFSYAQEDNSTTLETWRDFRFHIRTLASWDYKNVEKIKRTDTSFLGDGSCLETETCKEISAEWELVPIYAMYNQSDKTIYYYTTATKIYLNPSSSRMFASFNKLNEIDMTQFDTSKVTDMSGMFNGCSNLTTLNVSQFVTSKVTNMSGMFNGCSKLTSLDVSEFDTSNVTDMSNMFRGCSKLTSLDVSKFDTSKVTDMNNMFRGCSKLTTLDVSNFDTSKVTNMSSMFNGYKWTNLDISNFDTSKVTDMNWMFNGYSWNVLDVSNFDTKNVTDMNSMFYNCNKITNLDVSNFDTSKVEDAHGMFNWCSNIEELDLTLFNTMNVTNMDNMFNGCSKLTTIYVSNSFVLNNVISSTDMFRNNKKLVWWNGTQYTWTHVTWEYAVIDTEEHPWYFTAKDKESIFLPWEKFNVKIKSIANWTGMTVSSIDSKITSITRSYDSPTTENLETISILWAKNPIYAWYDNGTIFYYTESEEIYMNPDSKSMFQWLSSLKNLDLKDVYTNNVTDMRNMFQNCASLETLDISNFDTSNVTNMEGMFEWCESIQELNLENFNTSRVTNMSSMFQNCTSLERLNVSSFDTSSVWPMKKTFSFCTSLKTLDISNFDTSNVTNMNSIFYNMSNLETIYASESFVTTALSGWKNDTAKPAKNMFSWDIKLVWWNGTEYDSSMVESGYARIDKEWQRWYFTDILDKKYNITYNLDWWIISWEKTTYTQRDSFTLAVPTKEWYIFSWWVWSNWEIPELEVTILEHTKWDLEYTAVRKKIEEPEKSDSNKYSWWWGSKSSESTDNDKTKVNEKWQYEWESVQWDSAQWDSTETYNPDHPSEQTEAYKFAYKNWITTMPTIVEADMNSPLNRIAMAKMLSNYAINVLGIKVDSKKNITFPDVDEKLNAQYSNAVDLAYQLWIMWINIDKFRPFDTVTRAEFGTALSRMLYGLEDWENFYYETHLQKLLEEKIITVSDPDLKELRWYVMIMLMRSAKNE